ncbi:uncharacterized protein LOC664363 isoform X2 [Tribolium castaneum]|uniref:uncharacterized protein LOC664363 isoform X2 n=1 Tax=Tribolium castaneum TaxID=7070 RepID=UPI0000D569EB|nr:PREDICTED: uncharacterized protein LOC664363 isoform X1 [Tribolium castaneum]|eukprot:XP_976482.1 PREDICTED: uncharacterized protein LOC664363 isoform X1 [Tribolium castaneum]
MVAESFVIYIVAVVLILIVLAVLIVTCFRQKDLQNNTTIEEATRHRRYINRGGQIVLTNQQEDVYNISSRVQGQEQGQWPTHDNHVSLEHFTINETNKYNDDPPTYEEAMRIAAANNNNTAVAAVPKTTVTPTSTSTSTANQQ